MGVGEILGFTISLSSISPSVYRPISMSVFFRGSLKEPRTEGKVMHNGSLGLFKLLAFMFACIYA